MSSTCFRNGTSDSSLLFRPPSPPPTLVEGFESVSTPRRSSADINRRYCHAKNYNSVRVLSFQSESETEQKIKSRIMFPRLRRHRSPPLTGAEEEKNAKRLLRRRRRRRKRRRKRKKSDNHNFSNIDILRHLFAEYSVARRAPKPHPASTHLSPIKSVTLQRTLSVKGRR